MTAHLQLSFQCDADLTLIEEDNAACVFASKFTHMTRNLRHLDLAGS